MWTCLEIRWLPINFPRFLSGKQSACNARDLGSIPGSGRSPGEENGNPFQYFSLENSMKRRIWWATAHGSQRVGHNWATNTSFNFNKLRWGHTEVRWAAHPVWWCPYKSGTFGHTHTHTHKENVSEGESRAWADVSMSRGGPAIASKQLEATEEADSSSQPPEGAYPADILS